MSRSLLTWTATLLQFCIDGMQYELTATTLEYRMAE